MVIDRTQSCVHHCDNRNASSTVLHNNDIDAETVDVKPDSEHVLGQLCETGCEMFNGECEMARVRETDVDKNQNISKSSSSDSISMQESIHTDQKLSVQYKAVSKFHSPNENNVLHCGIDTETDAIRVNKQTHSYVCEICNKAFI